MTPEIITTCVIALFLIILLAGFLFGLGRGFNKSLVRILLVVAMLVITFFIVPSITKALMTVDISGLGISVAGETATSVTDIIVSVLNEIPQVADIANTTAYATIISVVPQMILNVVLFVVVFILLRLVSMIIYWIIAGICFSKKKTEGKNKHRLLGSLVGVVQNFLIFLVILVPIVGTVNILGDIETITTQPTTEAVSTASINLLSDTGETPDASVDENQISPYQTVNDVIDAYEASWVAKFLHSVKLDNACMYVFDELSTVSQNEQEYNLREEANNVAYIVLDFTALADLGELDLSNPETIEALNNLIDSCYGSRLTASLVNEAIPLATGKWLNNETFCGLSKPTVDGYDGVINDLLTKLGTAEDLQTTLKSTTSMIQSILETAKNIVTDSGSVNIESIGDLLTNLSKDETTLELAKDVIQSNIDSILDTVFPTPEDPANPGQPDKDAAEETYKAIISETVSSILDAAASEEGVEISTEMTVITETFNVAEKLMDGQAVDATDAEKIITALDNSTVILETLKKDGGQIQTEVSKLMENADETTKQNLTDAIAALENESNKADLYAIFGLNQTTDPIE